MINASIARLKQVAEQKCQHYQDILRTKNSLSATTLRIFQYPNDVPYSSNQRAFDSSKTLHKPSLDTLSEADSPPLLCVQPTAQPMKGLQITPSSPAQLPLTRAKMISMLLLHFDSEWCSGNKD